MYNTSVYSKNQILSVIPSKLSTSHKYSNPKSFFNSNDFKLNESGMSRIEKVPSQGTKKNKKISQRTILNNSLNKSGPQRLDSFVSATKELFSNEKPREILLSPVQSRQGKEGCYFFLFLKLIQIII